MDSVDQEIATSDETGIFETAADFFSLISLAVIYGMITYGSAMSTNREVTVLSIANAPSGVAQPLKMDTAYVALIPAEGDVRVRLYVPHGGQYFDNRLSLRDANAESVATWIASVIRPFPEITNIICHLEPTESREQTFKLFLELVDVLNDTYEVDLAFR